MKIIYRYLLKEVGELLLRYLWLVLLFWQAIQSVVEKADQLSLFIWSDVVEKEARDGTEDRIEDRMEIGDRTEDGTEDGTEDRRDDGMEDGTEDRTDDGMQ